MDIALGAVHEGVLTVRGDGTVAWCNEPFADLIGQVRISLLGAHVVDLVPLESDGLRLPLGEHPLTKVLLSSRYTSGVYTLAGREKPIFLEISASRIQVGAEAPGAVLVIRDVTELWHAKEELGRAEERARLVQERARLVDEAEAARRKAEQALCARDEFLSIAAHELNTPLAAMQLTVEHLRTVKNERAPTVRQLELIERQTKRLARLVQNLLEVSRIHAGRLALVREKVDLVDIAKDAVATLEPELERASCTLGVRGDSPVIGEWDRHALEQVVTNLLSNAIKYGDGKPIEVSVSSQVGFPSRAALLAVTDHGIGIAPEEQERIFERFERAAEPRHYAGLGLGLYIVRRIVEAHGGSVRVKSELARGATFFVELPLTLPRAP